EAMVGSVYRDRKGTQRVVTHADILVVAPYNAQVNALRVTLPPDIRVGTVDKFQGQEAPICLVSMTTSSGEEMPRDLAFLF
ncbi:AAA domain-containing protein, partial [Acinetobacter baumannii]